MCNTHLLVPKLLFSSSLQPSFTVCVHKQQSGQKTRNNKMKTEQNALYIRRVIFPQTLNIKGRKADHRSDIWNKNQLIIPSAIISIVSYNLVCALPLLLPVHLLGHPHEGNKEHLLCLRGIELEILLEY